MRRLGMKLTAGDIYSAQRPSLKDAVFLFGGGCTAEMVSAEGLLLTNHHCGFSHLQALSSLERDYMKYGFVARTRAEELPCKGLTVARVVRMEDVTQKVLEGWQPGDSEEKRADVVNTNIAQIMREATQNTHYEAEVEPLFYGHQYLLVVTEVFQDVRLVMAPPQCIGEFGGDTDNWMWPRHNGDFMVFRVYAGPDNKPAPYSPQNKPYIPLKHLQISLAGVQEGDFALVFGFPGFTQQYLPSAGVAYIQYVEDRARVDMRSSVLKVLQQAMRDSDALRIQYAAKEARISNAWKKWQGEMKGLERLQAVASKQALEVRFRTACSVAGKPHFAAALDSLNALYVRHQEAALARALLIEFLYYGPDLPRFAHSFQKVAEAQVDWLTTNEGREALNKLRASAEGFYKNFDPTVEVQIFHALMPVFLSRMPARFARHLEFSSWKEGLGTSLFLEKGRVLSLLERFTAEGHAALRQDPVYRLAGHLINLLNQQVAPEYERRQGDLEKYMRQYVEGLMTLLPDARLYWPDANGTLRVAYGRVMGYKPRDAVRYHYLTTHKGILEKYAPGDSEFDLLPEVRELMERKDFGPYCLPDGSLPVAFTTNCQTTGGNSGSPVLDARGRLIGINFDRAWESTMSDIMYHPDLCRNIVCDARYIVWVIDKWARASHLIQELSLLR